MIRLRYMGLDHLPVYRAFDLADWVAGEIREVPEARAELLLAHGGFEVVGPPQAHVGALGAPPATGAMPEPELTSGGVAAWLRRFAETLKGADRGAITRAAGVVDPGNASSSADKPAGDPPPAAPEGDAATPAGAGAGAGEG